MHDSADSYLYCFVSETAASPPKSKLAARSAYQKDVLLMKIRYTIDPSKHLGLNNVKLKRDRGAPLKHPMFKKVLIMWMIVILRRQILNKCGFFVILPQRLRLV